MNKFQRASSDNNSIARQTTKVKLGNLFNHWDRLKNILKLYVNNLLISTNTKKYAIYL